ncbi:MAG: hypothetical protein JXA21_11565 [Anaerolineae bacterium]|nr:hypothetical protein [Anaerolineae bacterium]
MRNVVGGSQVVATLLVLLKHRAPVVAHVEAVAILGRLGMSAPDLS